MREEQLLLIPETREEKLEREVKSLKDQCDKVRKSQFAKICEVKKVADELRHELETLKVAICRMNK